MSNIRQGNSVFPDPTDEEILQEVSGKWRSTQAIRNRLRLRYPRTGPNFFIRRLISLEGRGLVQHRSGTKPLNFTWRVIENDDPIGARRTATTATTTATTTTMIGQQYEKY